MDNKFYVSYEAARLLKEKGYNEETIYYYNSAGKLYLGNGHFNYNAYAVNLSAPSKSEAIDWLESNGIIIELSVTDDLCHWVFSIYMKGGEDILTNTDFDFESFQTRLEAEEASIIKVCEML